MCNFPRCSVLFVQQCTVNYLKIGSLLAVFLSSNFFHFLFAAKICFLGIFINAHKHTRHTSLILEENNHKSSSICMLRKTVNDLLLHSVGNASCSFCFKFVGFEHQVGGGRCSASSAQRRRLGIKWNRICQCSSFNVNVNNLRCIWISSVSLKPKQ